MTLLYDPQRHVTHIRGEGHRRDDGFPGYRNPQTGRVTEPIGPQSAPRALCGACWWPIDMLADDLVRHGFDPRQARRMHLLWSRRPACETCTHIAKEAA